jgi:uncharacterized phage protein (TIGR02216 family)
VNRPFPWDEAIGFGIGELGLASDAFWRLTPRELALAIRARRGASPEPPSRAALADLMTRFPDPPMPGAPDGRRPR